MKFVVYNISCLLYIPNSYFYLLGLQSAEMVNVMFVIFHNVLDPDFFPTDWETPNLTPLV